jgi:UDP-N-acetylmuramoylalanine-D-glutamate ligase
MDTPPVPLQRQSRPRTGLGVEIQGKFVSDARGPESSNLNILSTSSMKEAVEYSFNQTQNGKICLLSPGFASYNMYSGFPERGTDFQQKIKECSSEYETT